MAGLFDFITSKDPADVERRLRLAQGMAGMTTNPNAGLQAGIQSRIAGLQKERAATAGANKLQKQTAMAIQMLGDKFPMLTQALQAGIITPNDAITAARKGSDVKVVGKSLVDSTGKVLFTSADNSGGTTAAFQTLHQKAIAGGLVKDTPEYRAYMLEGGAKKGLSLTIGADGSIQMTQGGVTPTKLTETEGKAVGFYQRANNSNKIITELEQTGTELGQYILGQLPMTNFARSADFQRLDQAKRDWISAVLRLESGAAIGKDEFDNYDLAYFPQVGDSPAVLEQKRRSRLIHENSLKIQSGKGAPLAGVTPTGGATTLTYDPNTGELK